MSNHYFLRIFQQPKSAILLILALLLVYLSR